MLTLTLNINLNEFGTRIQTIMSHLATSKFLAGDENGDDEGKEEEEKAKITTT